LVEGYVEREKRAQYRTAILCSVIANVNSGKGKKYKPEDFMPKEKKQPMDMLKVAEQLNRQFGGVDRRGE